MTALAVVAFFVPAAVAIHRAQQRGELLELQRKASIVATRIAADGRLDPSALVEEIDAAGGRLTLYAADGSVLAGDGPSPADAVARVALAGDFAEDDVGTDLVAAVPLRTPSGEALALRIEAPQSASRGRFLRALAILAVAALTIIAIAFAVASWMSRRLAKPVEELTAWTASDIGTEPPPPATIAEIEALRAALVDDRHRIADLLSRERSFSSQVSHQLRTPVAAMRVAIETEMEAPRADATKVLRESLAQLDRLESTITSLLALARHTERPRVAADLLDVVRERVAGWQLAADAAGREVSVEGQPLVAKIDAVAVAHIVDVLVDNALRHGRGPVCVRVHGDASAPSVDVVDAGPAPRGRDPFSDTGVDAGHGIGLRLARTLAESVHGKLLLVDAPTTTFRLTLGH
jgi:signal transduction histidine kinase